MTIWSAEIKEVERLNESFNGAIGEEQTTLYLPLHLMQPTHPRLYPAGLCMELKIILLRKQR